MIQAGSYVTFVALPPYVATLPEESQRVFRFCLGRTYPVAEIDRWGQVVLDVSADVDGCFGGYLNDLRLEPEYLREATSAV